jgi:hypothetical protein
MARSAHASRLVLVPLLALAGGCTIVWDAFLERDLTADLTLLLGEAGLDPTGLDCAVASGTRGGHCSLGIRSPDETEALASTLELTPTPADELAVGPASGCLSEQPAGSGRPLQAWVGSRLPDELAPLDLAGPLGQLLLVRDEDSGQSCISGTYLYG